MIALFLLLAATAEPATLSTEGGTRLSIADVLSRVEAFDPVIRQRAFEQLRAEILLRRAQWNRVNGGVGLNVAYGIYDYGFGAAPRTTAVQEIFFDRLTANLTAQVNFPIYAGNQISGAVEAAEARATAAKLDKRSAVRDLKRAALLAYAQLVASTEQVQIAARAAERSASIVDLAERRKASGLSTEADVARARLNLLRRAEEVELRRGDQAIAASVLRAALVLDQDVSVIAVEPLAQIRTVQASGGGADRLEALSLRSQILALEGDRKVAFSGWLPKLELFGQAFYGNGSPVPAGGAAVDIGNTGLTQRFGIFSGNVSAGLRVTWTGWDFFVTRDNVARVEAERSAAEARLAADVRTYARERAEAAARVEQSLRRISALAGATETAATAVRLARVRYETGNSLLTEVLDAELEAISVEARAVQAEYDAASAHLDQLRAEGKEL
ncbi:MAG: TolC family protein [Deltaproteobacteria bacterium]|nr:TolC family protein [Deltaproteobacteria bacterium]